MTTPLSLPLVEKVEHLRQFTAIKHELVWVRGYSDIGDGGEGLFRWTAASAADDGGTRFNAVGLGSSGPGYQRLIEGDAYNVKWFGAVGDNAADDTVAIQRAIDSAKANPGGPVKTVFFPRGIYKITAPLMLVNRNGDEYSPVTLTLRGETSVSAVRAAHINATHVDSPAIIAQVAYACVFANLSIYGQNTWTATSGKSAQHFSTYADYNDGYFVVNSCRDNRYSPHAAIAIDPFHSSVASGDRYPGLSAYYTNVSAGGSTKCHFDRLDIAQFVVGVAISTNGATANAEAFRYLDCNISLCKSCVAVCQDQSRSTEFTGCFMGACKICIDCVTYGEQNGSAPTIFGGAYGGGWVVASSGAGSPLLWSGGYTESCYSLGYIGGGLTSSNLIQGVACSLMQTPTGYRDAVRLWAAGSLTLSNVTFAQQDTGETGGTNVAQRPVLIFSDTAYPLVLDKVDTEIVGVTPDASQRLAFCYFNQFNARMRLCHEDTNATNEALFDAVVSRDTNTNHNGIMASPGAEIQTFSTGDNGAFRKFDSRLRYYEKGSTSCTINANGTGSFTGANLDRDFTVGDLLYSGQPYTPTVPGSLSSVFTSVAGYIGKVTAVAAGQVDFVAPSYATAGTVSHYLQIPWRPRHFKQVDADCNFAGTPKDLTNVAPTGRLKVGMRVLDKAGRIPANTIVTAVSGTTATLSRDPTGGAGVETLKIYADPVYELPRMATYGEDQAPGTTGDVLVRKSDGSAQWGSQNTSRPAYTVANALTDRAYDANATTTDELADVLGTLIADLKASGVLQ